MDNLIETIPEQYAFAPEIYNGENLPQAKYFCVGGMGGSHLAADLLQAVEPSCSIAIHSSYGAPDLPDGTLYIAVSYSGDTEETIDFARAALARKTPLAVVAKGGELLAFAKEHQLPHSVVPETKLPSRMTLGFVAQALFALMRRDDLAKELRALASSEAKMLEEEGKSLAAFLGGGIPLFYADEQYRAYAQYAKIDQNETAKMPAFCNIFSESNHNEMSGVLSEGADRFRFLLVRGPEEHPRISKRMEVFAQLVEEAGAQVRSVELAGNRFERMLRFTLLSNWTSYHQALARNIEPFAVPLVEEFKKRIA